MRKIYLNETEINVNNYKEEKINGKIKISVSFKVTSEEYHSITTLLYNETFKVKIPEQQLDFRGKINKYSTSVTNLYEKNNIADFKVSFIEI